MKPMKGAGKKMKGKGVLGKGKGSKKITALADKFMQKGKMPMGKKNQ